MIWINLLSDFRVTGHVVHSHQMRTILRKILSKSHVLKQSNKCRILLAMNISFFRLGKKEAAGEVFFSSSYGRVSMIQVRHNKKMGSEGLSFYHPNLLCCLDQMLVVIELSQHLVSSSKTVRPIIPRGTRCMGYVKIMWSAVCSLAPHSHFAERARPHLCVDEPKRPTPVRRRLNLAQAVLVKLISIGLVLTIEM